MTASMEKINASMQALHVRTDSKTSTGVMYNTRTLILCSKSPVLTRPSMTFLVNPGGNTTGDMCSHANLSSLKKFLTVSTSGSTCVWHGCSKQVSRGRGTAYVENQGPGNNAGTHTLTLTHTLTHTHTHTHTAQQREQPPPCAISRAP
jgi:hypothetical protein